MEGQRYRIAARPLPGSPTEHMRFRDARTHTSRFVLAAEVIGASRVHTVSAAYDEAFGKRLGEVLEAVIVLGSGAGERPFFQVFRTTSGRAEAPTGVIYADGVTYEPEFWARLWAVIGEMNEMIEAAVREASGAE